MNTFEQYQNQPSSEKIGLVRLEASERLMGWVLYSGSIYSYSGLTCPKIETIVDGNNGVTYTEVASIGLLGASKYYFDASTRVLYLQSTDSSHPNGRFIACTYSLFFANVPVIAPHDLSTGSDVLWNPILKSTSEFGVQLDNDQLGVAIDGSGSIKLINDRDFWNTRYDGLYFENQKCFVYSWNRALPITEAKLIYRGRVDTKTWATAEISFGLKDILSELQAKPDLALVSDISGARLPDGMTKAKQRLIYGRVRGHRPTNIDEILDGYPVTGTISVTNGSAVVTGSGTSFLTYASPEDTLVIDGEEYTIDTVDSNTQVTLSEEYDAISASGLTVTIKPDKPYRHANRIFSICGNQIRQPSTTIVTGVTLSQFTVASISDLRVGDEILVDGTLAKITRISGDTIRINTTLAAVPVGGETVIKTGVFNVYIDDSLLVRTQDYSYSTFTGILTLNVLAEFNAAAIRTMQGTVTFTSSSRTVTGSGTIFTAELKVGDWIRADGQSTFYEILQIKSDTELLIRAASSYSNTGSALRKVVNVYEEGKTILTCDVLGKSTTGTSGGTLLESAPAIVEDLLDVAGLSSLVDSSSFSDAKDLSSHALGLVIPEKYNDSDTKTFKDYIKMINQSVFGSLYQTNDFTLGYALLDPERPSSSLVLQEADILKMSATADGKSLVKQIDLEWGSKEYDFFSRGPTNETRTAESLEGKYLAGSQKVKIVSTLLFDESSADVFSTRWAMLLERARTELKLTTRLQGARVSVTDVIRVKHEKLYGRMGAGSSQKMGMVNVAKKDINSASIEIDDLGNAFGRCATITESDALEYSAASDDDKVLNGYITDNYGLIDNDPENRYFNKVW